MPVLLATQSPAILLLCWLYRRIRHCLLYCLWTHANMSVIYGILNPTNLCKFLSYLIHNDALT